MVARFPGFGGWLGDAPANELPICLAEHPACLSADPAVGLSLSPVRLFAVLDRSLAPARPQPPPIHTRRWRTDAVDTTAVWNPESRELRICRASTSGLQTVSAMLEFCKSVLAPCIQSRKQKPAKRARVPPAVPAGPAGTDRQIRPQPRSEHICKSANAPGPGSGSSPHRIPEPRKRQSTRAYICKKASA